MSHERLLRSLDELQSRLAEAGRREPPSGLTDADPDSGERWHAAEVWAHMAEFVGYWQAQLEIVVRTFDGMPVPFGRIKTDGGRIAAIEIGRHRPIESLASAAGDSVRELAGYLARLDGASWQAQGLHQTLGVMSVTQIVARFVIDHLSEHLDQLDGLAVGD